MEVAGIVIGGVGLAALFDNCMNAFQCIDSGSKYGKDYQESTLKVSLIQLRLACWRKTVELVEDSSAIGRPKNVLIASDDEVDIVCDLLESISNRFKGIEKASMRHGLQSPATATQPAVQCIDTLTTRAERLALERQKTSTFAQKARWALHDKRKISGLVAALSELASDLVDLFSANKGQQLALTMEEVQELMQPAGSEENEETLMAAASLPYKTCQEVDPDLKRALDAAAKAMGRHSYGDAVVTDRVKLQQGDQIPSDYTGPKMAGGGHRYSAMTASGDSRVLQGDTYGSKSIWDD